MLGGSERLNAHLLKVSESLKGLGGVFRGLQKHFVAGSGEVKVAESFGFSVGFKGGARSSIV